MNSESIVKKLVKMGWSDLSATLAIRANFRCEYCDRDLLATVNDYKAWQNDHIVPVSRGGSRDSFDNLAVACRTCNYSLKGQWDPRASFDQVLSRSQLIEAVRKHIAQKRAAVNDEITKIRKIVHEQEA